MTVEERAKEFADKYVAGDAKIIAGLIRSVAKESYSVGATDQRKIDIDKACTLVEELVDNTLDVIENNFDEMLFERKGLIEIASQEMRKAMEEQI